METEYPLEKLPFPSPDAYSADYSVTPNTEYIFHCAECHMPIRLRLGWIVSRERPEKPPLAQGLQEAAEQLMRPEHGPFRGQFQFESAQCGMCSTVYIIQEHYQEHSQDNWRVRITNIARVLPTPAPKRPGA